MLHPGLAWALALASVVPIGGHVGDLVSTDEPAPKRRPADAGVRVRVRVVAFVGAECPLSELYAGRLAELADRFEPEGVAFVGMAPNARDSADTLGRFARAHGIGFPIVVDRGGTVAARIGVRRIPSVVVLDARGVLRYRGRIDDQYTLGTRRAEPGSHDLADAIEAVLAGRPVEHPETEVIGCPIEADPLDTGASTPLAMSYGRDVAPILRRRCVVCHSKGRIAPFGLATYRQAKGWAGAIAEAVEERRMPPWHADPAHGTFANDAHLSAREIGVLVDWARGGCPEGEPVALPGPAGAVWGLVDPRARARPADPPGVPRAGLRDGRLPGVRG